MSKKNLTIMLTGGLLPRELLDKVYELSRTHDFGVYLSTVQNLRLVNIPEDKFDTIRQQLVEAGADIKGPGRFPKPKVCVGKPHCNLAIVDSQEVARTIWSRFRERTGIKPKLKLVFSACPASCSNASLADLGIITTRQGYDFYVGGKGGTRPRVGRRIKRGVALEEVIDTIDQLVAYHQEKTGKKKRMSMLIDADDFPYPQAV